MLKPSRRLKVSRELSELQSMKGAPPWFVYPSSAKAVVCTMAGPAKRIPAGAWLASMVAINSVTASLRDV